MSRPRRSEVYRPDEIAIVHVMNRAVRRCFLLGYDSISGKNFDYRKAWIETELSRLAKYFGIDVLCYAVLSNHFHLVLRSRPDVVKCWNDREVARRWLTLCPSSSLARFEGAEPSEAAIEAVIKNSATIATIRSRLSDISWWMRLLSQNVAQRANREDDEVGKFWQARFRAVRLVDDASLLACAAYVDLNPIRAAMADSLKDNVFTSIHRRIAAHEKLSHSSDTSKDPGQESICSNFLSKLEIDPVRDSEGACCSQSTLRASDKGFLNMSLKSYITLLEWTRSQIQDDSTICCPPSTRVILEQFGLKESNWIETAKNFGRLFVNVAEISTETNEVSKLAFSSPSNPPRT